jgi:hypothetical protein
MKMFSKLKFVFSVFLLSLFALSANPNMAFGEDGLFAKADYYKNRYGVNNIFDRITDNFGNGFDKLYGTRNLRTILYGIAYRGGANNAYHKDGKRDNQNPLPIDGLENLAAEGFSNAIYLYKKNFDDVPKTIEKKKDGNQLKYLQNSLSNDKQVREMLELVYNNIKDYKGPIYLHCWNGWHQSGYAAALVLRQFCGLSPEKAAIYWTSCAEGDLSKYQHIVKSIKEFKPIEEFKISKEEQDKICPCMTK